jgi:hypothetical protein
MRNFKTTTISFLTIVILITGCQSKSKTTTGSITDSSNNSTSAHKTDTTPPTKDKKYTDRNDSLHDMGTPVGLNIIGRWMIEGSAGDVVLEFAHDGNFKWTNNGKEVSRGTYYFDESRNLLEMSGKGKSNVKIEGNTMTEKLFDGLTMVYKRL